MSKASTTENIGKDLCKAAETGDVTTVRTLLHSAAANDVNYRKNGMTALMWASCFGHSEVVKLLLADPRVDVIFKDKNGLTSYDLAASQKIRSLFSAAATAAARPAVPAPATTQATTPASVVVVNAEKTSGPLQVSPAVTLPAPAPPTSISTTSATTSTAVPATTSARRSTVPSPANVPTAVAASTATVAAPAAPAPAPASVVVVNAEKTSGPLQVSPAVTLPAPAPAPPTSISTTSATTSTAVPATVATVAASWLKARLVSSGLSEQMIKSCEQALIEKECFLSESDFAQLPADELTPAYLTRIGISAKGLQLRLIALHREIQAQHSAVSPPAPSDNAARRSTNTCDVNSGPQPTVREKKRRRDDSPDPASNA